MNNNHLFFDTTFGSSFRQNLITTENVMKPREEPWVRPKVATLHTQASAATSPGWCRKNSTDSCQLFILLLDVLFAISHKRRGGPKLISLFVTSAVSELGPIAPSNWNSVSSSRAAWPPSFFGSFNFTSPLQKKRGTQTDGTRDRTRASRGDVFAIILQIDICNAA